MRGSTTVAAWASGVVRRAASYAELDHASLYGMGARIWGLVSSPVTMVLITSTLTPELQGYYYAFFSILSLQVFAEFGLGSVVIPLASHEWARLRLDERGAVTGDTASMSRLGSLARLVATWYGVGGASGAVLLSGAGWLFFSRAPVPGVAWQGPWLALCATTGLCLFTQGLLYLMEGCNQVGAVYRCGFVYRVLSILGCWLALLLGAGLWAAVIPGAVRIVINLAMCVVAFHQYWRSLFEMPVDATIEWRREVWPFQWRIGVSWLSGYFIHELLNPVVFHFEGPQAAGRLGISLALAGSVPWLGYALVQPRFARFGALIAAREYEILDRTFWRLSVLSVAVAAVLSGAVLGGATLLAWSGSRYGDRLLSPADTGFLLLTAVARNVLQLQSTYLRAYKQEPLMIMSAAAGAIATTVSLVATRAFGVHGTVLGYLGVTLLFELPVTTAIFFRKRTEWRCSEAR